MYFFLSFTKYLQYRLTTIYPHTTLRPLEFHRWDLTWEDPQLLLCFGIILKDPRFIAGYNVPDAPRSSSIKFLQHMCASFDPASILLFSQVVRDPTGKTFQDAEMIMENCPLFSLCNCALTTLSLG